MEEAPEMIEKTKDVFFDAIKNNNIDLALSLLNKVIDLNIQDSNGNTPLHLAIVGSHISLASKLIEKNADPDIENHDGNTPLHLAIIGNHTSLAYILIEENVKINTDNLNIKNDDCNTPLHLAIVGGHISLASILIEKEAQINIANNDGNTPLHLAASRGFIDLVFKLIEKEAQINITNNDGFKPLYFAIKHQHSETVDFLLKKGANFNNKLILIAAENDDLNTIEILIKKLKNIDQLRYNDLSFLNFAAKNGYQAFFKALLKTNCNDESENIWGMSAIHFASQNGHLEIVQELLSHGAKVDKKCDSGHTPLHMASINGHVNIVKKLLDYGAKVDKKHTLEYIYFESEYKDPNIVDKLLECTALHLASYKGHQEVVEELLNRGAKVNQQCLSGHTPLHLASYKGHQEVTKTLLEKGAKVNKTTFYMSTDMSIHIGNRFTPLHFAAASGNSEVAQLLLDNGANVNQRTLKGHTPLFFACKLPNSRTAEALLQYGAKHTRGYSADIISRPFQDLEHYLLNETSCENNRKRLMDIRSDDPNFTSKRNNLNSIIDTFLSSITAASCLTPEILEKRTKYFIRNNTTKATKKILKMVIEEDLRGYDVADQSLTPEEDNIFNKLKNNLRDRAISEERFDIFKQKLIDAALKRPSNNVFFPNCCLKSPQRVAIEG